MFQFKMGKFWKKNLAGFNSDHVKTTLRHLCCFKMTLPLLKVLQKSRPIPLSLCYSIEGIINVSEG